MIVWSGYAVGHEVGVGTEGERWIGMAEPVTDGHDGLAAVELLISSPVATGWAQAANTARV